ncbi:MAG: FAD-binding oxidoreductase [Candidatus Freyarchaeota archaeon]|nr:FAD-binding oxidoreductase [Candidatus Jordarchaeia archaeon]MBS7279386.1 FAD-binding oxidoreductase [Candidatus Jordarchaeia archaeon]
MEELGELKEIVGVENVVEDPEVLDNYSRDYSFVPQRKPLGVIFPKDVFEIQKIIKWSNEHGIPLTPISSPGGPRFRGDTIPSLGGVIVNLCRMNRILRVDRRNKVAMVEPGVTFDQLRSELEKYGLRPYTPLLPRSTKSALTSYLEREPITIPKDHWDMLDPLFCIEVVFGTCDILRTGEASGPGTVEDLLAAGSALKSAMGPGGFDPVRLVQGAQGTLGIVSWATVGVGLLPSLERLFFVSSDSIENLIEFAYGILRRRLGEELFLVNNFHLANMVAEKAEEIGNLSRDLPQWVLILNISGFEKFAEERVEYQEKDAKDIAQQFGLELQTSISGISGDEVLKVLKSFSREYWKFKYKGCCQEIFFLTVLNRTANFIEAMYKVAEGEKYPKTELGVYIQPLMQGVGCHCEFDLMYNPTDFEEEERIKRLFIRASENLVSSGAFFSRPYGPWADMVYSRDAETTIALRKVKELFDPNGIMNPGKLCF